MKREVCKFFSGSFAALAYVHAAYAVATVHGSVGQSSSSADGGVSGTGGRRPLSTLRSVWYLATSAGAPKRERSYRNRQRLDREAEQATCGRR